MNPIYILYSTGKRNIQGTSFLLCGEKVSREVRNTAETPSCAAAEEAREEKEVVRGEDRQ